MRRDRRAGRRIPRSLLLAPALVALIAAAAAVRARHPGREGSGATLLPDGTTIAPVGQHVPVGDLPLAMAESPDGRFLLVTENGYARPSLVLVDLARRYVRSRTPLDNAWLGLAWNSSGNRVYSSAARENAIREFRFERDRLVPDRSFPMPAREIPRSWSAAPRSGKDSTAFIGGLCLDPAGARLYAVNVLGQTVSAADLASGKAGPTAALDAEPYTCAVSPDGRSVAVSLWGGSKVLMLDPATLATRRRIATGEHPNAIAFSRDGARLFVACANTNSVWVVDPHTSEASEEVSVAMHPHAPPGATPNSLGLAPDGRTLLVSNADNNVVAVVDVTTPGSSHVAGFIPAGWYPTDAQFSKDGREIRILAGKGLQSQANPRGPQPGFGSPRGQTTRDLLTGTLSFLPAPDAATLAAWTKAAYALAPDFRDKTLLPRPAPPEGSPIPARAGASSPIRHVFYVIRENRTYDQILGDLPAGDGDPALCLFGEEVTPNAHALARDFVLLDNFYVNAEVSYDGHAFSTGAYATDFVEKIWPMNYAGRGGEYLSEGGGPLRNPYGNVAAPPRGYLWDECVRKNVSVRSYGEFVHQAPSATATTAGSAGGGRSRAGPYEASAPGLAGRVAPAFAPFDLSISDNRRVDAWLAEFREFERKGNLPSLSIVRLGNDHTNYTAPGFPTPRAMIADNDLALGRLVEAVSGSRYWKESAIFVLEDDAQNGPDHVDCHRSVALVVSPWTRRGGAVDSTLYTTCGMLRTMELILGLDPLSQCDAAALPMYAAFSALPETASWEHRPARIPLDEKNARGAPGAAASAAADLREADRAPDIPFNEILWQSVRGARSKMPPPVRAGFVRPLARRADEDSDDRD